MHGTAIPTNRPPARRDRWLHVVRDTLATTASAHPAPSRAGVLRRHPGHEITDAASLQRRIIDMSREMR